MAERVRPVAVLDAATVRFPERSVGPLDLVLFPGTITAIVGASGSGKSTALNLLAGLRRPDEGRAVPGAPGRVSMVFQSPTLMPWADAQTNVALPLELAGVARAEARARAADQLSSVGLGDRLSALPRELSGGMAMRCALARALVPRPDLLLLDEPFAALDTVTRRRLIDDLHAAWAETKPAIVLVTHDVEEAVFLARTAVVLDPLGRVAARVDVPGDLPRPPGFRDAATTRAAVAKVSTALSATLEPAS